MSCSGGSPGGGVSPDVDKRFGKVARPEQTATADRYVSVLMVSVRKARGDADVAVALDDGARGLAKRIAELRRVTVGGARSFGNEGRPTVDRSRFRLCRLGTLAPWLGVGKPGSHERSGSATPTKPRPRRQSGGSQPAGSGPGSCGAWATGVRSGRVKQRCRSDTHTSTLSIGLRRTDRSRLGENSSTATCWSRPGSPSDRVSTAPAS